MDGHSLHSKAVIEGITAQWEIDERTTRLMSGAESDEQESDAQHDGPAEPAVWEPSVGFGVTLILTTVVLFLSVVNPREIEPVWDLDERLSLRALAAQALRPQWTNWRDADMLTAEAKWACIGVPNCPALMQEETRAGTASQASQASKSEPSTESKCNTNRRQQGAPTSHEPESAASNAQEQVDTTSAVAGGIPSSPLEIGVNLSLIPGTGWGHLAYEIFFGFLLEEPPAFAPIFLGGVHPDAHRSDAPYASLLASVLEKQQARRAALMAQAASSRLDIPILHAVDHVFFHRPQAVGTPNIALIFFDKTDIFPPQIRAAEAHFDAIVAGSQWNADKIRELGVANIPVFTVLQGVDPAIFFPDRSQDRLPAAKRPAGAKVSDGHAGNAKAGADAVDTKREALHGAGRARPEKLQGSGLVIFSGGKFEMRKAQDLVVNIFKRFSEEVPEARATLIFAWDNPWPVHAFSLGGGAEGFGTAKGVPVRNAQGQLEFMAWLAENGIKDEDAVDLGSLGQEALAAVLRDWADVGLFPNRCEGGTNLVAMEAMACGLPVVLSANTGHMDLIARACPLGAEASRGRGGQGCFALENQRRLAAPVARKGEEGDGEEEVQRERYSGWGESHVGEGVEVLRRVWAGREAARRAGESGAEVMRRELTWERTRGRLKEVVRELRGAECGGNLKGGVCTRGPLP